MSEQNKSLSLRAIDTDRVVNEKVVECRTNRDRLGLLQQLGIVLHMEVTDVTK